jgi:FkbM family methyltransferase
LTLTLWEDMAGSSFLPHESNELQLGANSGGSRLFIDSLIDNGEMTVPQLVKLDVQGFELEVLREPENYLAQ